MRIRNGSRKRAHPPPPPNPLPCRPSTWENIGCTQKHLALHGQQARRKDGVGNRKHFFESARGRTLHPRLALKPTGWGEGGEALTSTSVHLSTPSCPQPGSGHDFGSDPLIVCKVDACGTTRASRIPRQPPVWVQWNYTKKLNTEWRARSWQRRRRVPKKQRGREQRPKKKIKKKAARPANCQKIDEGSPHLVAPGGEQEGAAGGDAQARDGGEVCAHGGQGSPLRQVPRPHLHARAAQSHASAALEPRFESNPRFVNRCCHESAGGRVRCVVMHQNIHRACTVAAAEMDGD